MKKYQVIGGQYTQFWHGESDSLQGAMRIASQHKEYWDNWQGWHTPYIFRSDDCIEMSTGRIVTAAGAPVCAEKHNGKWEVYFR